MDVDSLVSTWRAPLTALIAGWGASFRDAGELAQDALAEAWLSRERFVGDAGDAAVIGPWLRGIAFRLHSTWRRRAGVRAAESLVEEAVAAADERGVAGDDEREELLAAIDRLPGPQRTVVLMRYLDDCRVAVIAGLLGITPKAVEGRLYQARKRLRALLPAPRTVARAGGEDDVDCGGEG